MACFHSDDLVNPLLPLRCETGITAKGHLQVDRAVQVEIARAEESVDPPIGICSRDSHPAVGRGDVSLRVRPAFTPKGPATFDEPQADPEKVCADDEIVIVGDDAHWDIAFEMREKLEDVGVDGEGGKAAYAQAGVEARRPAIDRRFEMPCRGECGLGDGGRCGLLCRQVRRNSGRRAESDGEKKNAPIFPHAPGPPKTRARWRRTSALHRCPRINRREPRSRQWLGRRSPLDALRPCALGATHAEFTRYQIYTILTGDGKSIANPSTKARRQILDFQKNTV